MALSSAAGSFPAVTNASWCGDFRSCQFRFQVSAAAIARHAAVICCTGLRGSYCHGLAPAYPESQHVSPGGPTFEATSAPSGPFVTGLPVLDLAAGEGDHQLGELGWVAGALAVVTHCVFACVLQAKLDRRY